MNIIQLTEITAFGSSIILLVVTLTGLLSYGRYSGERKLIVIYLAGTLLVEMVSKYYAYILKTDNLFILPVYCLFEFAIISWFYISVWELKARQKKLALTLCGVGLVVLAVFLYRAWNGSDRQHFVEAGTYAKAAVHFLLYMSALFLLYRQVKKGEYHLSLFNAGVLLYFTGSFFVFLSVNFLLDLALERAAIYWFANALLAGAFYFLAGLELRQWNRA